MGKMIELTASAGPGFSCDERGSFDAAASKAALDRMLDFFAQHVG